MIAGQLLMHYPIVLPADYDMEIIRERVHARGAALDDRAGLSLKAYCIRERGIASSPVNAYAPFYLWDDAGAAAEFLWGGTGFQGIVTDFGRPTVHTWVPSAAVAGPARAADVTHAVLQIQHLEPKSDLVTTARQLGEQTTAHAEQPQTHRAFAGIDPATWRTVIFHTVVGAPLAPDGTVLTVLHVSEPPSRPPRAL